MPNRYCPVCGREHPLSDLQLAVLINLRYLV